jgi:hypothetical protein
MITKNYDICIIGGGMAGLCAAIAAARKGVRTALIHNRPMPGGNASSEIRMHICGADVHESRKNSRETGILEEILLENKWRNPEHNYSLFDLILWEKAHFQPGLDLYLNTHMTEVNAVDNHIQSVIAYQMTSEKAFIFEAKIFVDATGDGTLAYKCGAEIMYGREAYSEYGEPHAPAQADDVVMGSTLMFQSHDTGNKAVFVKPSWAYHYTEEDFSNRNHQDFTSGYWWIELGGDTANTISDAEEIRDQLVKTVYGVWDHIKNSGNHPDSMNYALSWVGSLPGKRESRRVRGDYVLNENDCVTGRRFSDAIGYGGWPMDIHTPGGFLGKESAPTFYIHLKDVYTVPYQCIYSLNIDNLMLAGRIISASRMAFGSIRVMGTLAALGQACGIAAAMAIEKDIIPKDIRKQHIQELQQTLLKEDCYIPGLKNEDESDLARKASLSSSSSMPGAAAVNVINGVTRMVGSAINGWISVPMKSHSEWIDLKLAKPANINQVRLIFDSNLSKAIMPSIAKHVLESQTHGMPEELVKEYDLIFFSAGEEVKRIKVKENYQRLNVHDLNVNICDSIRVEILSTHGDMHARIFEIRAYGKEC